MEEISPFLNNDSDSSPQNEVQEDSLDLGLIYKICCFLSNENGFCKFHYKSLYPIDDGLTALTRLVSKKIFNPISLKDFSEI